MEFQKIKNCLIQLLMIKICQDLLQRSGSKFMISQKEITVLTIRIKTPMLGSDLCDFSDAYIVVKREITVTKPNTAKRNKAVAPKIMHHLSTVLQK